MTQVKYTENFLHSRKENRMGEFYQRTGEALDIGKYLVKVKWNDGKVELVPRNDLDGLPPLPVDYMNVFSLEEMASNGIHLKILEKWVKKNGEWQQETVVEIKYRRAETDKEKYWLSKAADIIKKKHELRGLTEYEWKMIAR